MICARYPARAAKGDQTRSLAFLRELGRHHEVTVLTAGAAPDAAAAAELQAHAASVVVPLNRAQRVLAAAGAVLRGVPAQVGWMMPPRAWRHARRAARDHDVVLAMTARSLRGPLPRPVVLDHVDALSLNMTRRARGPEAWPVRAFARMEAVLLRRHERRAAAWAAAQLATSREDADHLPAAPAVDVLASPWDGRVEAAVLEAERTIDVMLSGNMAYPPNRDAAEWLAREILPAVRRRRPDTSACVVGRAAAALALPGVQVASDVHDVGEWLRRARVAVVPLRLGTGSPNKLLEAVAAGAAVVATPWAAARFDLPCAAGSTAEELAAEIVRLLDDEAARGQLAAGALARLSEHGAGRAAERLEAILSAACR